MMILYELMKSQLGKPYIYGGNNPLTGFDCSGYVQWVLRSCGMDPPGRQNAQMLYDFFEPNSEKNSFTLGALVFYGKSVRAIDHIAILVDQYRVIEAGGGDSTTKTVNDALLRSDACVRERLIDYRSDRVAILKPRYSRIGCI